MYSNGLAKINIYETERLAS